jgi:hypothetical protein
MPPRLRYRTKRNRFFTISSMPQCNGAQVWDAKPQVAGINRRLPDTAFYRVGIESGRVEGVQHPQKGRNASEIEGILGWRRGSESNRRMRLLQSPALPLGYPATGHARKSSPLKSGRKSSFASFTGIPTSFGSKGTFWNPTPGCLLGRRLNPIGPDSPAPESGFRRTDNNL